MQFYHLKHKITVSLIVISISCFAQKDSAVKPTFVNSNKAIKDSLPKLSQIYIAFNAGPSLSIGFFGNVQPFTLSESEFMPESYGYAENGQMFNLLAGMGYGKQKWEIELMLSYVRDGFVMADFLNDFEMVDSYGNVKNISLSQTNYYYNFYSALAGIARTFSGPGSATFNIRYLMGFTFYQFPGASGSVRDNSYYPPIAESFIIGSSKGTSFSEDLGIGLNVHITPYLVGLINLDLFNSTALYFKPEVQKYNSSGGLISQGTGVGSLTGINSMNFTLGLGYAFAYKKNQDIHE